VSSKAPCSLQTLSFDRGRAFEKTVFEALGQVLITHAAAIALLI